MAEEKSKTLADLAPEEIPRRPAHKDTRNWCKGKEGRDHAPAIVIPENLPNWWRQRDRLCGWLEIAANDERMVYNCHHVEACGECGKVLRRHYSWLPQAKLLPQELRADECPDYTPAAP